MKKVISDTSTHFYFDKGDVIVYIPTGERFIVDKIDVANKKVITSDYRIFDLNTDIRPSEETMKRARVVNKKTKVSRIKKLDEVLFAKIRPNATIPSKRDEDGCYDLYAYFDEDYIVIPPHEITSICTGIISSFSPKYRIGFRERGSSGTRGLEVMAGLIDSGYRGEWFVCLNNTTDRNIIISKAIDKVKIINNEIFYPYSKAIAQFAVEFVPKVIIKEVSADEIKSIPSERGEGVLGSSGK
jgi:dUTP pyrophosphatase